MFLSPVEKNIDFFFQILIEIRKVSYDVYGARCKQRNTPPPPSKKKKKKKKNRYSETRTRSNVSGIYAYGKTRM